MIRLYARTLPFAALAAALTLAAPLAAQQTFDLPPASPSPTPAPAGPADERAGVAIPPRVVPTATPTPTIEPLPSPSASQPPLRLPAPRESASPARSRAPAPGQPLPAPVPTTPAPAATADPSALPPVSAGPPQPRSPATGAGPVADAEAPGGAPLPAWWPFAAGGVGTLVVLGGALLAWRRRKPAAHRNAAPAASATAEATVPSAPPRLEIALEITSATRSVMMFTIGYRLTIANRSDRAVNDCKAATRLACARAAADSASPAGAAQDTGTIARIGPHQARSMTGTLQLPLAAIAPLRQGKTPLFIPLVHVTLEGEGMPDLTKTFVIGTPSASGRVHPIALDQPPGGIAGLVAQAVALRAGSAAA